MKLYDQIIIPQSKAISESRGRLTTNRNSQWDLYGYDIGIHPLNMAIGGIVPTRLSVIGGRSGSGKAQPLYSRVYTPEGFTTIGQLKVGDLVLSEVGVPIPVTGVFPQGKRKTYRLYFSDGATVDADEDHLWKVYTANDRKAVSDAKPHKNSIISKDKHSILSTKELVGKERIRMCVGRENIRNFKLPICKPLQFTRKNLDIPPYALGALIGDGCFSRSMISSMDKQIIDRVQQELKCTIKYISNYDYRIGNCNFRNRLKALFGELKLSYHKFIPKDYLYSSVEDRIELLRGLMDTDGYVSQKGVSVIFYTSSPQLAKDVVELVNGLGGIAINSNRGKKTYVYKNEKLRSKYDSYSVNINLPSYINPFFVERKRKLVIGKTKYFGSRFIEKIECIGNLDTVCIRVDSDSHLYVTDGCVVTHNTTCTVPMFDAALRRKSDGSRLEYLFFTWELDPSIVIDRSICSQVGLTLRQLNQGAKLLSGKTMAQLDAAYDQISKFPITYQIHSTDINRVKEVALEFISRCREKSKVEGAYVHPVICIDYLNMAQFDTAGLRTYGIADFMNGLKQLCNQEKVSAIVFAQLSRTIDKAHTIPDRSDFSDSAAIENAADNLIVIYRPEYHGITTVVDPDTGIEIDSKNKMLVRVLKGRDYGTGDFLINCDMRYFRMWDKFHDFNHKYWADYGSEDFWMKQFNLKREQEQIIVPF